MSSFTNFDPNKSVEINKYATQKLGKQHWVVLNAFEYYVGDKQDDIYVRIPQGYLTDGATIPKPLADLIPAWGKYGAAAIIHDHLCEYLEVWHKGERRYVSRYEGDKIFYEAMKVLGVPCYKRVLFWCAVRIFSKFKAKERAVRQNRKYKLEQKLAKHYAKYGTYHIPVTSRSNT